MKKPLQGTGFESIRRRFLREVEQASGYAMQPSPSSNESVCPPLCTPFASLQEAQTSLAPPIFIYSQFHIQ